MAGFRHFDESHIVIGGTPVNSEYLERTQEAQEDRFKAICLALAGSALVGFVAGVLAAVSMSGFLR